MNQSLSIASLAIWAIAALLGTASLTLFRAERLSPDQRALSPKRLNEMLASFGEWFALVTSAALALYRFGLVWPTLVALILFLIHQMAMKQDLQAFYPFNFPIAVAALVAAIAAWITTL
jgi:hypothetical protein